MSSCYLCDKVIKGLYQFRGNQNHETMGDFLAFSFRRGLHASR